MLIEGAIRQLAKILDSYKKSASLNSLDSQDLYKKKLDLLLEQSASLERIDRDADPAHLRDSLLATLSLISSLGEIQAHWKQIPFPTKGQKEVMTWLRHELGNVNG
jgi:hypothetical protein